MEAYYKELLQWLPEYTVEVFPNGSRNINDLKIIQRGDRGRVVFFDQEPIIKDLDEPLWNELFNEPTILVNSELDSVDKNYMKSKYPNFVDCYFFSHALVAREWFRRYQHLRAGWLQKKYLTADFGLVTGPRQYRLYLYYKLPLDFFESDKNCANLAFLGNQDWRSDLEDHDFFGLLDIEREVSKEQIFVPRSYDNFGTDDKLYGSVHKQTVIPYHQYTDSNFVLVPETIFVEQKKHLTEKIFKPIAAGKPFVLASGCNNLAYLRNYGFKTFSDCWNESYDTVTEPKERLDHITKLVRELVKNGLEPAAREKWIRAHDIAVHNHQLFWSEEFKQRVIDEFALNMEIAKQRLSLLRKV